MQRRARSRRALLFPLAILALPGLAAANREAPFISANPKVDATDFYFFRSYEPGREAFVTLIANYAPAGVAGKGPEIYGFDDAAVYDIHVENGFDGVEDVTFRFRFKTRYDTVTVPVGFPGSEVDVAAPFALVDSPLVKGSRAMFQSYTVDVIEGDVDAPTSTTPVTKSGTGAKRFQKPVDNTGPGNFPSYDSYADDFFFDIDLPDGFQGRVFAGSRSDPFFGDLSAFLDGLPGDLLGLPDAKTDPTAGRNVSSIAIEVPIASLMKSGPVLGAWTTARLPRTRSLAAAPVLGKEAQNTGELIQVSRLGNPLVNEAIIGLPDKARFNATKPATDVASFDKYFDFAVVPELIEKKTGNPAPDVFPRGDLFLIYNIGIPGLNDIGFGDMLRLNTLVTPTPLAMQDPLGVLNGDGGFPNGRRVGDDVVDITLRAVMGGFLDPSTLPAGHLPLTDGVAPPSTSFLPGFPYVGPPHSGPQ